MVCALVALWMLNLRVPGTHDGWKLVWSDEFNGSGAPDPKNWVSETGFVRNKELQWYSAGNAFRLNGHLILEARRERIPNPNFDSASIDWRKNRPFAEYTSACLETRGLREFLYGRLEVRAKIEAYNGLWPAIWTLGVHGAWPKNGEVDQLEFYQHSILANTAWGNNVWNTQRRPIEEFTKVDPKWADKFHVWRMDWDPAFLRIYLDDKLVNETDLSKTLNPDGSNPFHQPQFILLDLAIGSTGGDPSNTKFPARFEVDYVRWYKKR